MILYSDIYIFGAKLKEGYELNKTCCLCAYVGLWFIVIPKVQIFVGIVLQAGLFVSLQLH